MSKKTISNRIFGDSEDVGAQVKIVMPEFVGP